MTGVLIDLNSSVEDLHKKIDALAKEVQTLTTAVEELLPAARRAAAMMGSSKTVKLMELLKASSPSRRG